MVDIWTDGRALRSFLVVNPPGQRIVLTNGCFDILHRGHFETIRFAGKQADILVVGINTDESVRKLKGPHRPINRLEDRAAMVGGIAGVDYVVAFGTYENPSVEPLIEQLRPDVLVKGGDYSLEGVVGAAVVQHYGGRVVIAPKVPDVSSTRTIKILDGITDVRINGKPVSEYPGASIIDPEELSPDRPWRILLDLDGVLVDFFGGMARALGYDDDWLVKRFAEYPGEYDPGKLFGLRTDLFSIFGPDWWESLPWTLDGDRILQVADGAVGDENMWLCSSPTHESGSPTGKLRWIERNFPIGWSRRYVFTPAKFLLANPQTILLDDDPRQIEAFQNAGGEAILVPRKWNHRYGDAQDAARFVEIRLRLIMKE